MELQNLNQSVINKVPIQSRISGVTRICIRGIFDTELITGVHNGLGLFIEHKLIGIAVFNIERDRIIIAAYGLLDERELNSLNSTILLMDENNRVERVISGKL